MRLRLFVRFPALPFVELIEECRGVGCWKEVSLAGVDREDGIAPHTLHTIPNEEGDDPHLVEGVAHDLAHFHRKHVDDQQTKRVYPCHVRVGCERLQVGGSDDPALIHHAQRAAELDDVAPDRQVLEGQSTRVGRVLVAQALCDALVLAVRVGVHENGHICSRDRVLFRARVIESMYIITKNRQKVNVFKRWRAYVDLLE